jgi:hypothetical protein
MEKVIVISEQDWPTSIYKTKEWEQSVRILRWEHDYVKKCYIINYEEIA